MRTCRERGIDDRRRLHRRRSRSRPTSDGRRGAIAIGPAPAAQSYLVIDKIIDACKRVRRRRGPSRLRLPLARTRTSPTRARAAGITFIGPSAERDAQDGQQDRGAQDRDGGRHAGRPRRQRPRRQRLPERASRARRREEDRLSRSCSRPPPAAAARACAWSTSEADLAGRARGARARGDRRVRRRHGLPREGDRTPAPHRDPGASATRTATSSTSSSATARSSAATRRSSRRRHRPVVIARSCARRWARPRSPAARAVELRRRRHVRVPPRRRRQLLLPRDEHAPPGRAPGHRDGHRPRSRRVAARRRRGQAAAAHAGQSSTCAAAATRSSAASTPRIR